MLFHVENYYFGCLQKVFFFSCQIVFSPFLFLFIISVLILKSCTSGREARGDTVSLTSSEGQIGEQLFLKAILMLLGKKKTFFKQGTINDISKAETWDWQSSRRTLSSCWQLWKLLSLTLQSPQWGEWLFEAISLWFILGKDKQTPSRALNSHSKPESTHAHSFCATHKWMLRVLLFKMIHSFVTQLSTNC